LAQIGRTVVRGWLLALAVALAGLAALLIVIVALLMWLE